MQQKCRFSTGDETTRHMVLFCAREASRWQHLRDSIDGTQPCPKLVGINKGVKLFVRWIMFSDWLIQFATSR
jgi:hypothetical protein